MKKFLFLWVVISIIALTGCTTVIIHTGGGSGNGSGGSDSSKTSDSTISNPLGHFLNYRSGVSGGLWQGTFQESFGSASSSTYIDNSWGGTVWGGFQMGIFFVDWSPTYLGVGKLNPGTANSNGYAYYLALLSAEFGISLARLTRFLPLEVFLGYDNGTFGFTTGSQTHLSGDTYKVGVNLLLLPIGPHRHIGLRGEWRRHFMNIDNAGPVPVANSLTTYYLGILLTLGS